MSDVPELLPFRMLNEFTYCPRLFHLEWVQGEWADNYYTEDGRFTHRRTDEKGGSVGEPEEEAPFRARAVAISAPDLGVTGRIDVLEGEDGEVTPVEYKRGRPPDIPERAWEPERIQVSAQVLALRENGYRAPHGALYFAASKERVEVAVSDALAARTRELIAEARACAARELLPPPLADSPKCAGCSLNGICLPDEVQLLADGHGQTRRLHPARDDALPCYVSTQGARVGVRVDELYVTDREKKRIAQVRLGGISQLCLLGNVQVSTQALRRLCGRGIPVCYFTRAGLFWARMEGLGHRNIEVRRRQYRAADSPGWCRNLARGLVSAKIANSRTLIRRNHPSPPKALLRQLSELRRSAESQEQLAGLLGVEGSAARLYFSVFSELLKPPGGGSPFELAFDGRNRRPPRDPVNALLSFAYAVLTKEWTVTVSAVGLDPYLGFYHQPRYGRPALALDLMEEFRPLIADSVVLSAINNGIVGQDDFVCSPLGVALKKGARRSFIEAYERRMDQLVTHPVFGYRISYRRVLEVQARLLCRHLLGEIPEYPAFLTR